MNKLENENCRAKVPVFPQKSSNSHNNDKLDENCNQKRDKTGTSIYKYDLSLSDTLPPETDVSERKKMFFAPIAGIHYREAKLTCSKEWFIFFYVMDPYSRKLKRIRIKVNREKNIRQRKKDAERMIRGINQRLSLGWNPLSESIAPKASENLLETLDLFLKVKCKEMESTSAHCYVSYINIFKKHLQESGFGKDAFVTSFNHQHAVDFLNKIEEQHSPKTFNNYLAFFKGLFIWMKEKGYVDDNPFDGINKKPKKLMKKNRRLLTDEELKKLMEFLAENNREYYIMVLLCYGCFIRPKEIALLKCKDINLEKQVVYVSADIAKNDNESYRTIPNEILPALKLADLSNPDLYLFGSHKNWDFTPGKQPATSKKMAKYWELVVRPALGFGMDLKFYSLKDTGITNMLQNGVPINLVQKQADHSSVAMTAIYVGKKADANNEIKNAELFRNID